MQPLRALVPFVLAYRGTLIAALAALLVASAALLALPIALRFLIDNGFAANDVGTINNERYFHEIVAKGKVITKGIQKETKSLEGQLMSVDVVETYVPLMSDGIFQGAFEIYYDITARKQQLDKLLSRSSTVVFIIALGLLLSIIVILFIENKTISKRKQVEKEREKLIAELQDAATKIKTLSGLLPICSSCKKIRDDKGYWKQIESYIRDHSEAEFTHSMCPICAKKFYPEFFQE